ncbi:MAG: hypothetical protein IJX77_03640 [Ruminococcus sp.]|nr:hypothetical protein [Ruminococcus sp.]
MMNVMKRAWGIYRTLTGDHIAKLSVALRQAWSEVKNMAKKVFEKVAQVAKVAETYDDSCYLTFKAWEKGEIRRIYINDYKRRTLGYIDRNNDEVTITDRQGNMQSEIDYAINQFKATYAF